MQKKSIAYYFIEVFARIWALWGIVTFLVTFLIVFIPSMLTYCIKGRKGQYIFILIARGWMRVWLTLIGCSLRIKGLQHFTTGTNYIVCYNHNTFLDVPLSCPFVPNANKTIAKDSFAKIPLFGWYYSKGAVLVNRKNERSRIEGYEKMKEVLAQGMCMCIYPEGTRNRTTEPLKPFYDGAFKLSIETQKQIIPALLFNTKKAMPVNKFFYLLPCKLQMHYLAPISSNNKTSKKLKEEVFEVMKEYYSKQLQNMQNKKIPHSAG